MTTRSRLPNSFYVDGTLLTIPIEDDETIPRWLERVAFIINYLQSNRGGDDIFEMAQEASRRHLNRLVLGVRYR